MSIGEIPICHDIKLARQFTLSLICCAVATSWRISLLISWNQLIIRVSLHQV